MAVFGPFSLLNWTHQSFPSKGEHIFEQTAAILSDFALPGLLDGQGAAKNHKPWSPR